MMVTPISFYSFVDEDGQSIVDAWYAAQSDKDQAKLDERLDALRELMNWKLPLARKLTAGECKGLAEIRFKAKNVQQRPLGCGL
jgi:hypothetical protein